MGKGETFVPGIALSTGGWAARSSIDSEPTSTSSFLPPRRSVTGVGAPEVPVVFFVFAVVGRMVACAGTVVVFPWVGRLFG